MKKFIKPILSIVDELTESKIHSIVKSNLSINARYRKAEYNNIAIDSSLVYESYLLIRESIMKKLKDVKPESVTVIDFGSGIGNVLALYNQLVLADKTLFPNLKRKNLYGIEKIEEFRQNSMIGNISPIDLINLKEVEEYTDWTVKNDLNIWYCNRPFSEMTIQSRLEAALIKKAPIGTYIYNPMGFSIILTNYNVRVMNKNLIIKQQWPTGIREK